MSNRLKELLPKPTFADYHPADGKYSDFYDDKKMLEYGARIVQECIKQIALIGVSNYEHEDVAWTADLAIEIIKERFGIEVVTDEVRKH